MEMIQIIKTIRKPNDLEVIEYFIKVLNRKIVERSIFKFKYLNSISTFLLEK